jgi:insulysin
VSDNDSKSAAASVNIDVGFCSDPDSLPGLAHLLEHVILLGTEPEHEIVVQQCFKKRGILKRSNVMESATYQFTLVASK